MFHVRYEQQFYIICKRLDKGVEFPSTPINHQINGQKSGSYMFYELF
jgi:hypothetical protein